MKHGITLLFVLLAWGLYPADEARAQADFFRVSPVSLSSAHKDLDTSGKCDSCRLRRQGFVDVGLADPTRYR